MRSTDLDHDDSLVESPIVNGFVEKMHKIVMLSAEKTHLSPPLPAGQPCRRSPIHD